MEISDSNEEIARSKLHNRIRIKAPSNKEIILCKHCKRTSSNGIRCLGMCVADNDYWDTLNSFRTSWILLCFKTNFEIRR